MTLFCENEMKIVPIGREDFWECFLSTVNVRLKSILKNVPHAVSFINSGVCSYEDGLVTAREINIIHDELSKLGVSKVVYNSDDLKQLPPWGNNISPIITSCGNYFVTSDGKDLLHELVAVLVYSYYNKTNIRRD